MVAMLTIDARSGLASKHATELLALYRAFATVDKDVNIDTFLSKAIDLEHVSNEELAFLQQNDIAKYVSLVFLALSTFNML